VRLGLVGEVFGDEEFRDFLLLRGEGAKVGDALFEAGGIPGKVAIDHDAGVLEVQPDAAGIGAEEEAAVRVVAEGEDLAAALLLRDAAGVPGVADAVLVGPPADGRLAAGPLR
jgi:hypothetical protein